MTTQDIELIKKFFLNLIRVLSNFDRAQWHMFLRRAKYAILLTRMPLVKLSVHRDRQKFFSFEQIRNKQTIHLSKHCLNFLSF